MELTKCGRAQSGSFHYQGLANPNFHERGFDSFLIAASSPQIECLTRAVAAAAAAAVASAAAVTAAAAALLQLRRKQIPELCRD